MPQQSFARRVLAATSASLLLMLTVSGCTTSLTKGGLGGAQVTVVDAKELPGPNGQTGADQSYEYRIGPYDKVIVDVFGFEQLTNRRMAVDGSGNITLPIAGPVALRELTLAEASSRIAAQLRSSYVRSPRVSVNLEESVSRFVTVDGEVEQPGNYPVLAGLTLMRGIAAARGATEFARLREVVIHRNVNGRQMVALYDLAAIRRGAYPDPVLYPNDVVVVGDSPSRRLFQQALTVVPLLLSPIIGVLDTNNSSTTN